MTRLVYAAALALAVTLPAVPAQAQSIRTFVSTAGSDTNPCSILAPCRHFSAAVAVTAVGGEVDALDAGAYGAFTISQAITIDGGGWSFVAPAASGTAIAISGTSSTDNIFIRGLSLNGVGVANSEGITFSSGGSLTVQNCVIRNFGSDGIDFIPSSASHLSVLDTLVSDNGATGIQISASSSAPVVGVLSRVTMQRNNLGLAAQSVDSSNQVTVSDSVSEDNNSDGIGAAAQAGTVTMMVRNSTIANNSGSGLEADFLGATIWLTRTTVTGNGTGWLANGGVVATFGTNEIVGNVAVNGAPPSAVPPE